jgi:O-antigen ligase
MTGDSIQRRPIAGLGYGTDSYEATMEREFPALVQELRGTSHAHNVVLEIAAESGIPAAASLLVLLAILTAGLLSAYRVAPARLPLTNALAICLILLVAITVYGMANYPLRRALGHFTVLLVGIMVGLAEYAQNRYGRRNITAN